MLPTTDKIPLIQLVQVGEPDSRDAIEWARSLLTKIAHVYGPDAPDERMLRREAREILKVFPTPESLMGLRGHYDR